MAETRSSDHSALLTLEEVARFSVRSDLRGAWAVLVNWALIAAAFALPAVRPHPLAFAVALVLLGNRQLGLGILMHDCAHRALFRTRSLNVLVGRALCAAPILASLEGYRRYHMEHHREAGTTGDPDYPNYKKYPVTRASLLRKVIRDLTGRTGLKQLLAVVLMHSGALAYDLSYQQRPAERRPGFAEACRNLAANLWLSALVHVGLWGALFAFGHAWLYLLWWLALLTTQQLFSRIRNAAEHASVPDLLHPDPRRHARTTYARWWERLTVAPNHVNYHLEHHWAPGVPPYRLRALHEHLRAKGALDGAAVARGYGEVLRRMTARAA